VLACCADEANTLIANPIGRTGMTDGKCCRRYGELDLEGMRDDLRSGPSCTYEDDNVAEVINWVLPTKSADGSTHWSARSLAAASRIFHANGSPLAADLLGSAAPAEAPPLCGTVRLQALHCPFFVEKVRGIAGLLLNPPVNAMLLCVDEKTQIQALDPSQPLLPMGLGACRAYPPPLTSRQMPVDLPRSQ
jgi:putative transposase